MSTKFYGDPIFLNISVGTWYVGKALDFSASYVDLRTNKSTTVQGGTVEVLPGVYSLRLPVLSIGNYFVQWYNNKLFDRSANFTISVVQAPISATGTTAGQVNDIAVAVGPSGLLAQVDTNTTSAQSKLDHITVDVKHIRDMTSGRWSIQGSEMLFYAEDNSTLVSRYSLLDQNGTPTVDPSRASERTKI